MTDNEVLKLRIKRATSEELKELTLMLLIEASETKMLLEINELRILVHELQRCESKLYAAEVAGIKDILKDLTDRIYIR